ncbi:hypothetical protein [Deinococcus soli (ex Cha et al. 2016)]|uniref:Type II secretory pathway pseudopilin PulG n=2 Tax=Deinococcus soli (ex Cha et al. 2016) TaxID=1309411 RepID=A0ACC6KFJ2_9DEIO|nr:hypothetical protein [Deinococcus soli (ex Cha et al. 2016)]MDR6218238.1 type II secretory pathway pseudopilin PulG [Deinococcus soli (ex Cha et al. 2016)]MDR6328978.1 type II secretory pathway pseudopilin PulG [Deinococcus soli (ex Cha et al. 2016)]MDR6751251.1 type II secretory pathway pseudopilin PulG [Deinococcus soli (ex Cha et al. 2016)]
MNTSPPSPVKALTIIELLVGIAILIVLVGLAIAGGNTARARAYNTQALVCGEQIRKAQTLYYSEKQAFADAFGKLDPKMVARCALVSVVEVTASAQGYTYTVAHARGNAKYTVQDDRGGAAVLAGNAENGAGAADTSSGGQVVGPVEKVTGSGSLTLEVTSDAGVYAANVTAPAGMPYRLIHPNGFVDQGVIQTTSGNWSALFANMPAGEYTLELPYKHVVGVWQSVFDRLFPITGTCSAYQPGVVDAAANTVRCKTTLGAGQNGTVRLMSGTFTTPPLPSLTVMPDAASIGSLPGLYDSSVKYRSAWRLNSADDMSVGWLGETGQYWNYAGVLERMLSRAPGDLYNVINVDRTGYSGPSYTTSGNRMLEAGRVRMLTSSVTQLPGEHFPGNLDYVVKVPMVETTTALVVNLNFPEVPANVTSDPHYTIRRQANVSYSDANNAIFGYEVISLSSWAAPHRTVTGAVFSATYTPTRDFTGVVIPEIVNTTGGLVRYVPVGLSDGSYQSFTAPRGAPADTVVNITYKKQTRAGVGAPWVDAP